MQKKNVRQAAERNRLKRLVRESFRHHKTKLHGLDLVVMAKKSAENANNQNLLHALSEHWEALSRKFSISPDS